MKARDLLEGEQGSECWWMKKGDEGESLIELTMTSYMTDKD